MPDAVQAAELRAGPNATEVEAQVAKLEEEQRQLLEQVRSEFKALPPLPEFKPGEPERITDQRARRAQLVELLREVERRIEGEKRVRYVTPAIQESRYQAYYDHLCREVEAQARADGLPKEGGVSIYGRVVVTVRIAKDGKLEEVEVVRSPSEVLARHSVELLRRVGPYAPFPPDIAKDVDTMVITTTMSYLPKDEEVDPR